MPTIRITFDGLKKMKFDSVTDYCRMLMADGVDPKMKIEVYRGEMLCLTVSSIEEGAKLEPDVVGFRKYRPDKDLKARRKVAKPRTEV